MEAIVVILLAMLVSTLMDILFKEKFKRWWESKGWKW